MIRPLEVVWPSQKVPPSAVWEYSRVKSVISAFGSAAIQIATAGLTVLVIVGKYSLSVVPSR